jgi:tetratricopeptide (TPR) repeat protein
MASSARIDELKKKFDENERRYFAPLANEYRKIGDLEQAILICEQFLPQQPGHMSGHIVYGQALFESGRLDDAHGVFETALSLDPENLIALRHLGDIAARRDDPTSARRWYERVLEADPRSEEILGLIAALDAATPSSAAPEQATDATPEWRTAPEATPAWESGADSIEIQGTAPTYPPPAAEPAPSPAELLDLELSIPSAPETASPAAPAAEPTPELGDFEPTPDTSELMPDLEVRAEGFESTEFAAPSAAVEQATGLQSAFDDEVSGATNTIAPLAGLESHPGIDEPATTASGTPAFPELDEPLDVDEGLALPPHGDAIAASAAGETDADVSAPALPYAPASPDAALLDIELPLVEPAHAASQTPADEGRDAAAAETASAEPPVELPPEVIAAEAELIDARSEISTAPVDDHDASEAPSSNGAELSFLDVEPAVAHESEVANEPSEVASDGAEQAESSTEPEPLSPGQRPFVTETMAELYLQQGFRSEALAVYEQLSVANPGDARLVARIESLRSETAAPTRPAGPPVRDFFARLAARRPGDRAAAGAPPAEDDFASEPPSSERAAPDEGPPQPTASSAPAGSGAEPPTQAAASEGRSAGSIDALFGNRPAGSTEDSAASALAQAFGGSEPEAPPIAGQPARPAAGELSLDSVFREGSRGARVSQGFSFDQFFSQHPEGERTSGGGRSSDEASTEGEPAERTADDIEQFNAWLQGLKQR